MSVWGLLIAVIGFAVLVVFIAAPLLSRTRRSDDFTNAAADTEALRTAYERVKSTLRDLDEDYTLGKLDEADYRTERERWLTEGARLLAVLDADGAQAADDPAEAHIRQAREKLS